MKLFAVCMSCALLHWMQHDAAYSTSRTRLENTPVMAVRVCTCSHGQRTKYTNTCCEHPTMLVQNSFPIPIPASIAGKLGLPGLAIFISRLETTEKIRNKVEKWIGCYHLKVAILKSARSDFPIKTEHVQNGIQLNTYMGLYGQLPPNPLVYPKSK